MMHCARFRHLFPAGVCIALAVLLLLPAPVRAAGKESWEDFLEDTQALRLIFSEQGYKPIASFEELGKDPEDEIVVLLESPNSIHLIPRGLVAFVERGGAVMIASSRPPSSVNVEAREEIETLAGVAITGQMMVASPDQKALCYDGRDYCPVIIRAKELPPAFHRLFQNPRGGGNLNVYVNDSSRLTGKRAQESGSVLASLEQCVDEADRVVRKPYPCFAVGGQREKGRYMILANDRLFINRMMLAPRTENIEFAQNCLAILETRRDGGKRTKLLFAHRGMVSKDFNVPLQEFDPLEKLPELLAAGLIEFGKWLPKLQANLARAEDNDEFHRGLWRILDDKGVTGRDVLRWMLLGVSTLFAVYCFARLVGPGRHRVDPATPLLPRVVDKHRPHVSLTVRRRQEMLANDNLWEAARDRARAVLLAAGLSAPISGARAPRVEVVGGLWSRLRTRRWALRLWRLAFDETPQIVPKSAWSLVSRELDELRAALARGAVKFV